MGDNTLHPIMSAGGPAPSEPERAEGDADIVIDDNQAVHRNLIKVHYLPDRDAAIVHIGLRTAEKAGCALNIPCLLYTSRCV